MHEAPRRTRRLPTWTTGQRTWAIIVGGLVLVATAIVAGVTAPRSSPSTASATTPSESVRPSVSAATTHTATTPSAATGGGQSIRAYVTGYSFFDNTPPGSAAVSNPVLHRQAGGTGSYADPITVAVGHVLTGGKDILDWKAGTRFYIPNIRRYVIVEDACGDGPTPQDGPCHTGFPRGASTWLDVWVGGEGGSRKGANSCLNKITGVWDAIVNPPATYAIDSGSVYGDDGCTQQFGNQLSSA